MSSNIFILIPTNPSYVPNTTAQENARNLLASFMPEADEVSAAITQDIEFFDAGANFDIVHCPKCGVELSMDWWGEAMDKAYAIHFQSLNVTMPCCGADCSLNDLVYDFPMGFARFALQARNPKRTGIEDLEFAQLERVLDVSLRRIWAHY